MPLGRKSTFAFLALLILFGLALVIYGVPLMIEEIASSSWPSDTATVVNSSVLTQCNRGTCNHPTVLTYSYTANGSTFYGETTVSSTILTSGWTFGLYYNPRDPGQSLTTRGLQFDSVVYTFIGVAAVLFGLMGLLRMRGNP